MVRLEMREVSLGRVRERERRSSVDSWSEEVVVEGWVESGLVGGLVGLSECWVVVTEGKELTGSGWVAIGREVAASVEAMNWFGLDGGLEIWADGVEGGLCY